MQVVKARDHIKDCREKMETLLAAARDELLEEVEELEDEMAAAEDRIAAKEAADQNKEVSPLVDALRLYSRLFPSRLRRPLSFTHSLSLSLSLVCVCVCVAG